VREPAVAAGVGGKTLTAQQTLYGPELGIGIKF
jgi:hypothetical protein